MGRIAAMIREAVESSFTATTDIYGQGMGTARGNLEEALQSELTKLSDAQDAFEQQKAVGQPSEFSEKLNQIVTDEKQRVVDVQAKMVEMDKKENETIE